MLVLQCIAADYVGTALYWSRLCWYSIVLQQIMFVPSVGWLLFAAVCYSASAPKQIDIANIIKPNIFVAVNASSVSNFL